MVSNALARFWKTTAVFLCKSIAQEILLIIDAIEVQWFFQKQVDNSRVSHIF